MKQLKHRRPSFFKGWSSHFCLICFRTFFPASNFYFVFISLFTQTSAFQWPPTFPRAPNKEGDRHVSCYPWPPGGTTPLSCSHRWLHIKCRGTPTMIKLIPRKMQAQTTTGRPSNIQEINWFTELDYQTSSLNRVQHRPIYFRKGKIIL